MAVYSTDQGRLCPDCQRPKADCVCRNQANRLVTDGAVRVHREIKGRSGKPVSIIRGLTLSPPELKQLCQRLKKSCGVGGSLNGSEILIQGDQRETILTILADEGIQALKGGG